MRTITTTFDETRVPARKNLPCPDCGVKLRRAKTFTGTSNPFTTPPYRTPAEIRADLRPAVEKWQTEPERCTPCRRSAYDRARVEAEKLAEEWDSAHPIGTAVEFLGNRQQTLTGVTRGPARPRIGGATAGEYLLIVDVPLTVDESPSWAVPATELTVL